MIAPELYEGTRVLAASPAEKRVRVLDEMSDAELKLTYDGLRYDWRLWRRPKQVLPPGDWSWCVFSCGRGFGKTRTETEILREAAESGEHSYVSMTGATAATLKRALLYGPAGIMTISPPWFRPVLHSVDENLVWPRHPLTGVQMICYLQSGEDPDRFRGGEVSLAICDEMTTWNRPDEGWRNIDLTLRHGPHPRGIIGVTPKRAGAGVAFSRDLLFGKRGTDGRRHPRKDMVIVHGSTVENVDISPSVLNRWEAAYRGTTDELSELEGQLQMEAEGALWIRETFDHYRRLVLPVQIGIERLIISVDPSRSVTGTGDLAGIITVGRGSDGHCYLFADDSERKPIEEWMDHAVARYEQYRCNAGIYEQNRLGEDNVRLLQEKARQHKQHWVPVTARGKKKERAEPIAGLYREGRVHHVGEFPELEDEMVSWDPGEDEKHPSPNRIDALVHGVKELLLSEEATRPALIAR